MREEEDRTEKGMDTKRRWSLKSRHFPVGETQKEAFDSGRRTEVDRDQEKTMDT